MSSTGDLPNGLSGSYWRGWSPRLGMSVNESLDNGEEWIGSWDGVGLYEQNNKVPSHQDIIVHLTTHRLLLLQALSEPSSSKKGLQTNMSYIRQTEFYVGFMRSSPKITLTLGPSSSSSSEPGATGEGTSAGNGEAHENWCCPVCGHGNTIGHTGLPRPEDKCGLCGVTYGKSSAMGPNGRATPLTTSRPSTPKPEPVSTPANGFGDGNGNGNDHGSDAKLSRSIPCPACTFLNHPSIRNCEICDSPLPRPPVRQATPSLLSQYNIEGAIGKNDAIRLSFRKGGSSECYRRLKNVLSDKAWESKSTVVAQNSDRNGHATPRGAGIDGIMQSISLEAKTKDDRMQDAFKDLEVLMVRAGEMVKLAQSLSSRLPQTPQNSQEETLLRTSLVQLGLPTPALTQDMVRDDRLYLEGLAKELGVLLVGRDGTGGLMLGEAGRGVVGLDEVWVIWMRARGVALLPPSTLLSILPDLPRYTNPSINLLTLPSSLKVLHTPQFSTQALLSRILHRLDPFRNPLDSEKGREASISVIEVASIENVAIGLAQELMESVEMSRKEYAGIGAIGGIVRDDQAQGGARWYRDIMSDWHIERV